MRKVLSVNKKKIKKITAQDVGRYLKQMSAILRDPHTGNPEMSEALLNLSIVLIESKFLPAEVAASKFAEQGGFDFAEDIDFELMGVDEIESALRRPDLTKAYLIILGAERFGIARSRMEKLSRDDIIHLITAAAEHEKSLDIISEEAKRGGKERSS